MSADKIPTQRALVLQGGGALGAYDVGVFQAIYEKIKATISNDDSSVI